MYGLVLQTADLIFFGLHASICADRSYIFSSPNCWRAFVCETPDALNTAYRIHSLSRSPFVKDTVYTLSRLLFVKLLAVLEMWTTFHASSTLCALLAPATPILVGSIPLTSAASATPGSTAPAVVSLPSTATSSGTGGLYTLQLSHVKSTREITCPIIHHIDGVISQTSYIAGWGARNTLVHYYNLCIKYYYC